MFLFSSLGFIFGLGINKLYILFALAVTLLLQFKYFQLDIKKNLFRLGIITVITIGSAYISGQMTDFSYDGLWYHQTGILFLKKGWNPIYMSAVDFFRQHWEVDINGLIWIDSYPKFYEIVAANIYYLTGNIETGHMLYFLSIVLLFCYSFFVFEQDLLKGRKKLSAFFSLLLVLNPIVIVQMATYYVDGLVYIYFMVSLFALVVISRQNTPNLLSYAMMIMSIIVLANLKHVGVAYAILELLVFGFYLLINRRHDSFFMKSCVVIVALFLLTAINPYFTNLYRGKHILYPVAGEGKIDIMSHNMPSSFRGRSMPYKLFMSTFGRVGNAMSEYEVTDTKVKLKIPFTITISEIPFLARVDTRQSGFGVLWSGILLISLFISFFIKETDIKDKKSYLLFQGILILSVLVNPENWWARYVPQFYAVPIVVILFYLKSSFSSIRKTVSMVISAIVISNSMITYAAIHETIVTFGEHKANFLQRLELQREQFDVLRFYRGMKIPDNFTSPMLIFLDAQKDNEGKKHE